MLELGFVEGVKKLGQFVLIFCFFEVARPVLSGELTGAHGIFVHLISAFWR